MDTFSTIIRNELCAVPLTARHCVLAEISAMINGKYDTMGTIERFNTLLQYAFNINYIDKRVIKATEYPLSVMHLCCKRAYIRGLFITSGICNDPNNSYHLEYILPTLSLAERLCDVFKTFDVKQKRMRRKNNIVVYLKESDSIVSVLAIMEAHKSMLAYENVRVLKEMRNDVNRKVNFETANLTKTVNAAVSQLDDIQFIEGTVGLGYLKKPLQEVARLRLAYENASLQEIGLMLDPPVGKSGVNHRLRKISEIAEDIKASQNKSITKEG